MKGKLTYTRIESATCPQDKKSIDLPDGDGLLLRVLSTGKKLWRYRYKIDKATSVLALGGYPAISLQQARQLRDQIVKLRDANLNPTEYLDKLVVSSSVVEEVASPSEVSIKQVIDEYLATLNGKPSYTEVKRCLENKVISKIGTRRADSVTKRECVLLIDAVKEHTPVQANRLYAYLKRTFKVGMQRGLIENNPMEYVVKPDPHADIRDNRLKVLTRNELRHILNYDQINESRYHDALLMILWTGARPKEVLNMKWSQIEGSRWTLGPREHKNGFRRAISVTRPLCIPAQEILVKYQGNGCEYVFAGLEGKPGSVSALGKFVTRYRNRYGIDGFSPNHLRHTMSTRMREIGVRPDIVERLIGHNVDTGIISVYSSYSWLPEMREALEKWQNYLRLI